MMNRYLVTGNYDSTKNAMRDRLTNHLLNMPPGSEDREVLFKMTTDLNKAWDELTDALVRQKEARDEQISWLLSVLAEAKK